MDRCDINLQEITQKEQSRYRSERSKQLFHHPHTTGRMT